MSQFPKIDHPLVHNGTSQVERLLDILQPESFKLDDRSIKDFIVSSHQYAKLLCYYNYCNEPEGDWTAFWEVEGLTFLAVLSEIDLSAIEKGYFDLTIELAKELEVFDNSSDPNAVDPTATFNKRFLRYLAQLAERIQNTWKLLPDDSQLKKEIEAIIKKDTLNDVEQLQTALINLIAWHKAADPNLNHERYHTFFSAHWGLPDQKSYDFIKPNLVYSKADFDHLLKVFLRALRKIKMRANHWFDQELAEPSLHQPHIALFLTFLNLFRHAQNSLNALTEKQLDFYYEKVLCIQRKEEVPDEVYLLFELAKDFNNFLVEEGSLTLAGKDQTGKQLAYETIEDWVISKTQIAELKSTYLGLEENGGYLAASETANSGDGIGGPFNPPDLIRWRGLGDDANRPLPDLGFAIATPQLILKEGQRKIALEVIVNQTAFQHLTAEHFELEISTEEEMMTLYRKGDPELAKVLGAGTFDLSSRVCKSEGCFAEMEAARRMVADFTADVGVYVEKTKGNAEVETIYTKADTVNPLLEEAVKENAFFLIKNFTEELEKYDNTVAGEPEAQEAGALFFKRAYTYWTLAKTFAPPASTESLLENPTTLIPKSLGGEIKYFKLRELYDFLLQDLRKAMVLLPIPTSAELADRTKIYKPVAAAFTGRVVMEMGLFAQAKTLLDEVVNLGIYSFAEEYTGLYSDPNHIETLLWLRDDCTTGQSAAHYGLYNYNDPKGEVSDKRVMAASAVLARLYTGQGDDLRINFFQEVSASQDPLFPEIAVDRLWCNKYYQGGERGIPLFRYSEVLFNKAVCEIQLGNEQEGVDLINLFRTRAGLFSLTSVDFSEVLNERFREFSFEGDRRDFLQSFQEQIPSRSDGTRLPWDSPRLYFKMASVESFNDCCEAGDIKATFDLDIPNDFPPIVHLEEDNYLSQATKWPYLKIKLRKNFPQMTEAYRIMKEAQLKRICVHVEAYGIRENLIVQNDRGVYNGNEEFFPFGASPKIGNQFYLGSAEVFQKKLDCLDLHFDWIDPPNLGKYYKEYEKYYSIPNPQINVAFQDKATLPQKQREKAVTASAVGGIPSEINLSAVANGVSGLVTDPDGNPLVGLTISVKGDANTGTVTGLQGEYFINVSKPETILVFSYTGYADVETQILQNTVINVVMGLGVGSKQFALANRGEMIYDFELNPAISTRDVRVQHVERYLATNARGVIRISLQESDFLHDEYYRLSGAVAIDPDSIPASIPNVPYTPATNGISLDYCSTQKIYDCCGEADGIDQFFHLEPFAGVHELPLKRPKDNCLDMVEGFKQPSFNPECMNFAKGNLYIGLSDFTPGENLSLLIQTLEGTEKDFTKLPPKIVWSHLTENNKWIPFGSGEILKDSTEGLTKTGLVQLTTSSAMVKKNTLFNDELHWIRISAHEELDNGDGDATSILALPDIISIRSQGIIARFKNQENETSHLANPLPKGTISKLVVKQTEVKTIEQPFESFGGRLPENGPEFYRRVSERLRHKDRAVTIWDYEHLLLEQFSKIHRAKCISHSNANTAQAPGYVMVAVIPDISQRSGILKAEPRFSFGDLEEMEDFLRSKTNLFVATDNYLQVLNPNYEPVRLKFNVKFKDGVDEVYHRTLLNEELNIFLAPWLNDVQSPIPFGSPLALSKIIYFIEGKEYVEGIANFHAFHYCDSLQASDCSKDDPVQGSSIVPGTAASVLTAYVKKDKTPNDIDHCIRIVSDLCNPSSVKAEPC